MSHYVLTRSAYGLAWAPEANRRRFAISRAITARSLVAQNVDWTWVVLLDEADPLLKERMALYADSTPSFLPIVISRPVIIPRRAAAADYQADWRANIPSDGQVLLTRLDDDDAFAPDALARYQAAAVGLTERTALILPVGVHLWRNWYAVVRHEANAMHTLVTPPGDTACVYDYGHTAVAQRVPTVVLDDTPGWLWVRHAYTISSARNPARWGGQSALLTEAVRRLFPVAWDAVP